MTEAEYPQVRIVPERLLFPITVERLLTAIVATGGVRRMSLNGPRLPAVVPYGPARGVENPHYARRKIRVGDQDVLLEVQVGTVVLELEDASYIPRIREACESVFTEFPFTIQEGRFMKTRMTVTDYAKYGPDMDKDLLGLTEPGKKGRLIIIQGGK
ncbi:MAG: methyl-coenzyme M reductase operon protein D [Methanomicrobiales archaeon]|nr:methyl-coenzyme M reductase operon protein D [Methanomicrobiales archaeon]